MENNTKQKISTPAAIVVAGLFVAIALLITKGGGLSSSSSGTKTLSEQVGVKKDKLTQCLEETSLEDLSAKTNASAEKAMSGVPANERGTPYSVIVGSNGVKTEIRGAYPKEMVNQLIAEVNSGKVTTPYTGNIEAYQVSDHIIGNPNAPVMIIEYSDLECPYCSRFNKTMKEIIAESDGKVAWVYRHWVVHPTALSKTAASECIAKIKGEDAFFEYIDLVFGLMDPKEDTTSTSNL